MKGSAHLPSGERVYAIGDVHGRLDLLADLIAAIRRDNDARPTAEVRVILLGDLVDRGPASADVLTRCQALAARHDRFIVLKGNHEAVLVDALDGSFPALAFWLRHGGDATLASCGVAADLAGGGASLDLMAAAKAHVPADTVAWLRDLPLTLRRGDCLFVHAGIRPGVPLSRQTPTDLLWIRDDFIESTVGHPYLVVHGHTIEDGEPVVRNGRLGIDTGAYRTGRLTAACIEGDSVRTFGTDARSFRAGELAALDENVAHLLDFGHIDRTRAHRSRTLRRTAAVASFAALLVVGTVTVVRDRGTTPPAPAAAPVAAAQAVPRSPRENVVAKGSAVIAGVRLPGSPAIAAAVGSAATATITGGSARELPRLTRPSPLRAGAARGTRPSDDARPSETASTGSVAAPVPSARSPAPLAPAPAAAFSRAGDKAMPNTTIDAGIRRIPMSSGAPVVIARPAGRPPRSENKERLKAVDAIRALRRQ